MAFVTINKTKAPLTHPDPPVGWEKGQRRQGNGICGDWHGGCYGIYTVDLLLMTLVGVACIMVGKNLGLRLLDKLNPGNIQKIVYAFVGVSGLINVIQYFYEIVAQSIENPPDSPCRIRGDRLLFATGYGLTISAVQTSGQCPAAAWRYPRRRRSGGNPEPYPDSVPYRQNGYTSVCAGPESLWDRRC